MGIDPWTPNGLTEHKHENHLHLLFKCNYDQCHLTSFGTIQDLMLHFREAHGIFANRVQFVSKQGAHYEKCTLPKDLRKAYCVDCRLYIFCRDWYQIKKHEKLVHGKLTHFRFGCRICPDFQTEDISLWNNHFSSTDHSRCTGMDLSGGAALQGPILSSVNNTFWRKYSCEDCNVNSVSYIDYFQHINGRRHKENILCLRKRKVNLLA